MVDHDENCFGPHGLPPKRRPLREAGGLLPVINGLVAGLGSVYVTTQSVPITVVAGIRRF